MPRADRYMMEGYTYHLTHRCHNRAFLLNLREERKTYREWLREGARRYGVPVFAYSVTSNHVHLVVNVTDRDAIGRTIARIAARQLARESSWTEGLAVCGRAFVERIAREAGRTQLDYLQLPFAGNDDAWCVREALPSAYVTLSGYKPNG